MMENEGVSRFWIPNLLPKVGHDSACPSNLLVIGAALESIDQFNQSV
jgi:hypothetical protein